jgi:hypothetical protein
MYLKPNVGPVLRQTCKSPQSLRIVDRSAKLKPSKMLIWRIYSGAEHLKFMSDTRHPTPCRPTKVPRRTANYRIVRHALLKATDAARREPRSYTVTQAGADFKQRSGLTRDCINNEKKRTAQMLRGEEEHISTGTVTRFVVKLHLRVKSGSRWSSKFTVDCKDRSIDL